MGRLASYVRPFYGYIAFTMLIKLLGAVAELFIPYFMELVLGVGIESGKAPLIVLYGSAMLVAAFLCLALNILANRMTAKSSGQITLRLRHDLYEKLNSLSSAQMDALTLPSAEARLTSDTYHINQFLARGQRMGVRAPILLLGGLVMMLIGVIGGAEIKLDTFAGWGILLYLAALSAVAYAIWGTLLKYNPVSKVTIYSFMIPVCGVIISRIIIPSEKINSIPMLLIALALVPLGIFLINYSGSLIPKFLRKKKTDKDS